MRNRIFMVVVSFLIPWVANAADSPVESRLAFQPGSLAEGAPAELKHWAKMIGRWSTVEESLKRDGTGWEPSKSADWDFFWSFDGWGIQDNYRSPPLGSKIDNERSRQRGTNLRIFDPNEKKWIMTWLTVASKKPATFTAVSNDDEIVMRADTVDPNGNHSRITFFDIRESSFEWKLEWSQDEENWLEVYRIHGTKKTD